MPDSLALALSLGQAYFMLGKREQAEDYLRAALAALYGQFGEQDKAREYFDKALYREQGSASVYQAFMRVRTPL